MFCEVVGKDGPKPNYTFRCLLDEPDTEDILPAPDTTDMTDLDQFDEDGNLVQSDKQVGSEGEDGGEDESGDGGDGGGGGAEAAAKDCWLLQVTPENRDIGEVITLDRGEVGKTKTGPHGTLKNPDTSHLREPSSRPRIVLTGGQALRAVLQSATSSSKSFAARTSPGLTQKTVPSRLDKDAYRNICDVSERACAFHIIRDPQFAYEGVVAVVQDLIRWHAGEHTAWVVCAVCRNLCTISALRDTENFGWWVNTNASTVADIGTNAADWEAVIGAAPLHTRCEQ